MTLSAREIVDRRISEVGIRAAGQELGVAAILFTYRCTISCRHCCFGCSRKRPEVLMDAERCVRYLADLHETGRVIHIAGGECMAYWDELVKALEMAQGHGVQPHFIETNASFATTDAVVRERFERMRVLGLVGILSSADPYHQASVPPENFLRVRAIGEETFGRQNVWMSMASPEEIRDYAAIAKDEDRLSDWVRRNRPMFVGSAYNELSRFVEQHPIDRLPPQHGWRFDHAGPDCAMEFDRESIWELHIDPYDNIQTNCGVILGKANQKKVKQLIEEGPGNANFISRILVEGGPLQLARWAHDRHGFDLPETEPSKCGLCYVTRSFLRRFYPDILGPEEVYS